MSMAHRELSIHAGDVEIQAIFCKLGFPGMWQAGSGSQHLLAKWPGYSMLMYVGAVAGLFDGEPRARTQLFSGTWFTMG